MRALTHAISPLLGLALLVGCASAPTPRPVAPQAAPQAAAAPEWIEGVKPAERAFYGVGSAAIGDDLASARQIATTRARDNLAAELEILANILRIDHRNQVDEIVTRYPTDDFNAHVQAAAEELLAQAQELDTYEHKDRNPATLYVLLKLAPNQLLDALQARPGLPDQQKERLKTFGDTFLENAMTNLAR
jgi:hypothetical protein